MPRSKHDPKMCRDIRRMDPGAYHLIDAWLGTEQTGAETAVRRFRDLLETVEVASVRTNMDYYRHMVAVVKRLRHQLRRIHQGAPAT